MKIRTEIEIEFEKDLKNMIKVYSSKLHFSTIISTFNNVLNSYINEEDE